VNVNFPYIFNTRMTNLEALLGAGVHFGHQVGRWNPKMAPYIFETKNGMHILDLVQTLDNLETARAVLKRSKHVLFVGTKPQIAPIVEDVAKKCNAHYVNTRWVGGLLTNWKTMSVCLKKLNRLDRQLSNSKYVQDLSKKDILQLKKQRARLEKFFGGLRELRGLPDLVVIVGQPSETNAVDECRKLGITTITLLDSNCDPTLSTYGITANDDSTRSVALILTSLVDD
jgi:small subunit ribosomal protein S2